MGSGPGELKELCELLELSELLLELEIEEELLSELLELELKELCDEEDPPESSGETSAESEPSGFIVT